mgnify:CR=1 FL=1
MTGWRSVARDFINRQLENDEPFLVQTKMLSGKRIIVLMPDILLPDLVWLLWHLTSELVKNLWAFWSS